MNNSSSKYMLLGIAAVLTVIAIGAAMLLPSLGGKPSTASPSPSSSPGVEGTTYVGIDTFTQQALTATQLDSFKFAMHRYLVSTGQKIATVTFTDVTYKHDNATNIDSLSFNVALDKQPPLQGRVQYPDSELKAVQVFLTKNGTQVFDSGMVKVESDE